MSDWQWISMRELARLLDKQYIWVTKLYHRGTLSVPGIHFVRLTPRGRIWVQIDRYVLDRLRVTVAKPSLHP